MKTGINLFSKATLNTLFLIGANGFNAAYGFMTFYYCNSLGATKTFASYISLLSIVGLLAILVNFGHHFSATKRIAVLSNDRKQRDEYISRVLTSKSILLCLALGIYLVTVNVLFPEVNHTYLLVIGFLPISYEAFFPYWFFNGIGDNAKNLLFNALPKSLIVVYLLLLHPGIQEALTVISISSVLAACAAWAYIMTKKGFCFQPIKLGEVRSDMQLATHGFLTIDAVDLPLKLSKLLSATFFGPANIIAFELYEKIFRLFRLIMTSANQSLIPQTLYNRVSSLHKKQLFVFIATSVITAFVIAYAQDYISEVFVLANYSSAPLFSLLIFALPCYACTEFLGNGCLLFCSRRHQYTRALYGLIGLFILVVFTMGQFTKMTAAVVFAYLMFELFIASYVIYSVSKLNDD